MPNAWLNKNTSSPPSKIRLFCLHYAGGAANIFSSWADPLNNVADVYAVQLPGRWERHSEKAFTNVDQAVAALQSAVGQEAIGPFAVLGYSLGALIGFEWIRLLRKQQKTLPIHFFVLSRAGPQTKSPYHEIYKLSDDQFLKEMQKNYGGVPEVIFQDEDLRNLFLPVMRADMEMFETYKYREEPPLEIPITAIRGTEDIGLLSANFDAWSSMTSSQFHKVEFKAGHFFVQNHFAEVLNLIRTTLTQSI